MIRRLRARLSLTAVSVLFVVFFGTAAGIGWMSFRGAGLSAERVLDALAENEGERPRSEDVRGAPPYKPFGDSPASMANFYVIRVGGDGTVVGWDSDRPDLYAEEDVSEMAEYVKERDSDFGRRGGLFYRRLRRNGEEKILVLDRRAEIGDAERVFARAAAVSAAAFVLLSLLSIAFIRKATKPVEESFLKQKRFIADAGHELKTPLAVISANADIVENEIGVSEPVSYIKSEIRRADDLIGELLTLAKTDGGEGVPEMKTFNASDAALSVVLPFEAMFFEAGKSVEVDIEENLTYKGDEASIKRLVSILVSNALKYSDDGDVVRVGLKRKCRNLVLSTSNKASERKREDAAFVFDRFWRGDESHNRGVEGYGLGLSIAENIVRMHGGRITAEFVEGTAIFTAVLPE